MKNFLIEGWHIQFFNLFNNNELYEGGNTKLSISFDIDLSTLIDVVLENNDSENINCEIWRYTESDVYILTVYILTYGLAILKIRNFQDDLEKQSA
ncbi:hypothetical protein RhiirB3_447874 [Rhizophagus irregularis]|nr:hypothetical protein RhiirB3_447874 [Rhizophagus irregularis]